MHKPFISTNLMFVLLSCSLFFQSACSQPVENRSTGNIVSLADRKTEKENNVTKATAEIQDLFLKRYTDSKGIHIETLLSALGAVSGFGCQMAVREALIDTGKLPEDKAFVIVQGKDGSKYYFGDQLNQPLLVVPMSVLQQTLNAAKEAGADQFPDYTETLERNAQSVGGCCFGVPNLPKEHYPHEMPMISLKKNWSDAYAIMKKHKVNPMYLGWIPATISSRIIVEQKSVIDPETAARIVLESALPMSKVDPKTVIAH